MIDLGAGVLSLLISVHECIYIVAPHSLTSKSPPLSLHRQISAVCLDLIHPADPRTGSSDVVEDYGSVSRAAALH